MVTHNLMVIIHVVCIYIIDSDPNGKSQLMLEGNVVHKGECRPIADSNYMNLKKRTFLQASQPKQVVKQLDKAVVTYKPVSVHRIEVSWDYSSDKHDWMTSSGRVGAKKESWG